MARYWIIGMGGVAMASLAVCLKEQGHEVAGSDEGVYPPMSDYLRHHGIQWVEGYQADRLPAGDWTVVVGNAVPRGNPQLETALDRGSPLTSLPELVRANFLPGKHSVVISGTHGKTTTSNLCALLLLKAGLDPGWLIGGKPDGLPVSMHSGSGPFVSEGDEYDTVFYDKRSKFLHYWPRTLVINHLEFDHGDIFADLDAIKDSFRLLLRLVPASGAVLVNGDSPHALDVVRGALAPVITFGESESCDCRLLAHDCGPKGTNYRFLRPDGSRIELESPLQGVYNGRNIAVALLLAARLGIADSVLRETVAGFHGPARRMDAYPLSAGRVLLDDFAHHPTAIREALTGIRERWAGRRITALFEPRSNTAVTRVMQPEFQEALAVADRVVLGPLHRPWKYAPETLFDFRAATEYFAARGIPFLQQDDVSLIPDWLDADLQENELWVIFSNGSFNGLRDLLRTRFGGQS
ncbi:MAG: hypothetical protein KC518_01345 [Candidatus Cloacimonetes bacterium]|nr:hypothetical protein [Candidatus Cloacimonadota bacterium]